MEFVLASNQPSGVIAFSYNALNHTFGTFLPDLLTLAMFTKYARNGLGRYPCQTRITLFTLLLISGSIWPIVSFLDAGIKYTNNGNIWNAYGLNRYRVFFCTLGFKVYVDESVVTFIHMVRARDFLCLLYLVMAGIELSKSLRLFRAAVGDAKKGGTKQGAGGETAIDGEEIDIALNNQKVDADTDFKNEAEVEVVGKFHRI